MNKRLTKREVQRIATTKARHGEDIYSKGGKKTWANIRKRLGAQNSLREEKNE